MADRFDRFLDKSGREVLPGDYIVYGHALGRCAGLQYGRVLSVIPHATNGFMGVHAKIRVQGVSAHDNYLGYSKYESNPEWRDRRPDLLRPGVLEYQSRVLKVDPHQIPEAVRLVLERLEIPGN